MPLRRRVLHFWLPPVSTYPAEPCLPNDLNAWKAPITKLCAIAYATAAWAHNRGQTSLPVSKTSDNQGQCCPKPLTANLTCLYPNP